MIAAIVAAISFPTAWMMQIDRRFLYGADYNTGNFESNGFSSLPSGGGYNSNTYGYGNANQFSNESPPSIYPRTFAANNINNGVPESCPAVCPPPEFPFVPQKDGNPRPISPPLNAACDSMPPPNWLQAPEPYFPGEPAPLPIRPADNYGMDAMLDNAAIIPNARDMNRYAARGIARPPANDMDVSSGRSLRQPPAIAMPAPFPFPQKTQTQIVIRTQLITPSTTAPSFLQLEHFNHRVGPNDIGHFKVIPLSQAGSLFSQVNENSNQQNPPPGFIGPLNQTSRSLEPSAPMTVTVAAAFGPQSPAGYSILPTPAIAMDPLLDGCLGGAPMMPFMGALPAAPAICPPAAAFPQDFKMETFAVPFFQGKPLLTPQALVNMLGNQPAPTPSVLAAASTNATPISAPDVAQLLDRAVETLLARLALNATTRIDSGVPSCTPALSANDAPSPSRDSTAFIHDALAADLAWLKNSMTLLVAKPHMDPPRARCSAISPLTPQNNTASTKLSANSILDGKTPDTNSSLSSSSDSSFVESLISPNASRRFELCIYLYRLVYHELAYRNTASSTSKSAYDVAKQQLASYLKTNADLFPQLTPKTLDWLLSSLDGFKWILETLISYTPTEALLSLKTALSLEEQKILHSYYRALHPTAATTCPTK
jgi:hypothetical protein